MVEIAPPPPRAQPEPKIHTVQAGATYIRLYNPASHNTQALTFRRHGPLRRFDHHKEENGKPADDQEHGILYAAETLSGCLVEIFGDTRVIEVGAYEVAHITVSRELKLLDLRDDGAMKAGTVAAVCKDSNHSLSQVWSRYFYDNDFIYGVLDGLIYGNAHNDETAIALYERSESALHCTASTILSDEALRTEVQLTAAQFGLVVTPY